MSGQYKWNPDTGDFSVVGSKATERPDLEKQGSLMGWADETAKLAKWQEWAAKGGRGPRGQAVTDMAWVREVADRYGFSDMEIPDGSVVWDKEIKSIGGRCFYYPGRVWAIGLSLPRHQLHGRPETERTLAHELVHAYLWEKHGVTGHGADFKAIARSRGIPRYCENFDSLPGARQPTLGEKPRPAPPPEDHQVLF